jgi:hypothetical protein
MMGVTKNMLDETENSGRSAGAVSGNGAGAAVRDGSCSPRTSSPHGLLLINEMNQHHRVD